MTSADVPATRRDLRDRAHGSAPDEPASPDPVAAAPEHLTGAEALAWVDGATRPLTDAEIRAAAYPYAPVGPDLLARAPKRRRTTVLVPIGIAIVLVAAYVLTTLLWPAAWATTTTPVALAPVSAPAADPAWPAAGTAAVAIEGIDSHLASGSGPVPIASITKLVTAALVIERLPLAPGDQGPSYPMTVLDGAGFLAARINGESALNVPVGGSLTEFQLLQGMLIGSANNYAERLAGELWASDAEFADAARAWLADAGIAGITIVEPTGLAEGNTADAAALIPLAKRVLADPVLAGIVATRSVEIPGAGLVKTTNGLLADPGVVGLKTGTLDAYNVLAAEDVAVGDRTVRLYAAVLGQPDDGTRVAATRALFDSVASELVPTPVVPTDTVVATVSTPWGASTEVRTTADVDVMLWNGATAPIATAVDVGDSREAGSRVGTLTASGSLGAATTDLRLTADLDGPDPLWRLTHPLTLFGLTP